MKITRVCTYVLLAIFLLSQQSMVRVEGNTTHPSSRGNARIVCNWMYADAVGEAMDEASESIHVAMYLVVIQGTVEWLIDKLVEAQERGVEVLILMDNDNDDEGEEQEEDFALSFLEGKGLTVKLDRDGKMVHSKLIIIDNRTVIMGSTNWSDNSIHNNNEANARIDDPGMAAYFERYFRAAWNDPSEDFDLGIETHDGMTPLVDRDYLPNVLDEIGSAGTRIYLLLYAFKLSDYDDAPQNQLFDAIVNASRRGVDVRVCLEYSDWEDYINEMNQYTINKFISQGVNAYFDDDWQITHSKLIVVDDSTILGSTNWAYSGLSYHHNADVIIRKSGFTRDMVEFYGDFWEVGGDGTGEEMVVYQQISEDEVDAGSVLEISGYVNRDWDRLPGANISCWLEDAGGSLRTDRAETVTDDNGKYFVFITVPDEAGELILRTKAEYGGSTVTESKGITIVKSGGTGDGAGLGVNLRLLIMIGVFILVLGILVLSVLKKREQGS